LPARGWIFYTPVTFQLAYIAAIVPPFSFNREQEEMIGDKVVPKPHHTAAAEAIHGLLKNKTENKRMVFTVAGESGAGKSEIAVELARFLTDQGAKPIVFQQDDYFFLPPKTNAETRKKDIGHVGLNEVNLALLDEHARRFKFVPGEAIEKPLVVFEEDRITKETVSPEDFDVMIAEGTYTTLLNHADVHIFIARSYVDTLEHRKDRARDTLDEFSERILEIEHNIISKHRSLAEIIVDGDYSAAWSDK
jgi:uridine kinase